MTGLRLSFDIGDKDKGTYSHRHLLSYLVRKARQEYKEGRNGFVPQNEKGLVGIEYWPFV